jgi:hypothetical protein
VDLAPVPSERFSAPRDVLASRWSESTQQTIVVHWQLRYWVNAVTWNLQLTGVLQQAGPLADGITNSLRALQRLLVLFLQVAFDLVWPHGVPALSAHGKLIISQGLENLLLLVFYWHVGIFLLFVFYAAIAVLIKVSFAPLLQCQLTLHGWISDRSGCWVMGLRQDWYCFFSPASSCVNKQTIVSPSNPPWTSMVEVAEEPFNSLRF